MERGELGRAAGICWRIRCPNGEEEKGMKLTPTVLVWTLVVGGIID